MQLCEIVWCFFGCAHHPSGRFLWIQPQSSKQNMPQLPPLQTNTEQRPTDKPQRATARVWPAKTAACAAVAQRLDASSLHLAVQLIHAADPRLGGAHIKEAQTVTALGGAHVAAPVISTNPKRKPKRVFRFFDETRLPLHSGQVLLHKGTADAIVKAAGNPAQLLGTHRALQPSQRGLAGSTGSNGSTISRSGKEGLKKEWDWNRWEAKWIELHQIGCQLLATNKGIATVLQPSAAGSPNSRKSGGHGNKRTRLGSMFHVFVHNAVHNVSGLPGWRTSTALAKSTKMRSFMERLPICATQQLGMLQAEACQGKLNLSSAASTTSVI